MEKDAKEQSVERDLSALEYRVDELVRTIEHLAEENRSLRSRQQALVAERAKLIEKNDLARTRVESMINRLKSMEHGV